MKLRIRCDLIIDIENETVAMKIVDELKKVKNYFKTIRLGEIAEERSYIVLEKCYHDENPSKPCEIVFRWKAGG